MQGGAAAAQWGGSWSHIQQLVTYGLGSPADSKVSRYQVRPHLLCPCPRPPPTTNPLFCGVQLSLALLLAARLPGLQEAPLAFDPAFSELDVQLLEKLGIKVRVVVIMLFLLLLLIISLILLLLLMMMMIGLNPEPRARTVKPVY